MIEVIEQTNFLVSIAGLCAVVVTAFLLHDLMSKRSLAPFIQAFGLYIALLVSFIATLLTLTYSEVFGIIPCGLCWFERVMLYPQVLMLLTALYVKDTFVARYGIVLSAFGLIISLYHHFIQMGGSQFIKCPAAGIGADCAKRFIFEFGFVTFPLLAAILFAFLIVLYTYILLARSSFFRLAD